MSWSCTMKLIPVGAVVTLRLLGVIEGDQTEDGNTVRNDRLVAVTTCSHEYEQIKNIEQLGKNFLDHLTQFWDNYNALKGKQFEVRGVHAPKRAASRLSILRSKVMSQATASQTMVSL